MGDVVEHRPPCACCGATYRWDNPFYANHSDECTDPLHHYGYCGTEHCTGPCEECGGCTLGQSYDEGDGRTVSEHTCTQCKHHYWD